MTNPAQPDSDVRLDAAMYDLLMDAANAIYAALAEARQRSATPPSPPILQLRAGLAESPGWFLIQAAEFDPQPLTVAALRRRDIYASERIVAALLELLASETWLDRDTAGAYALNEAGRAVVTTILQRRQTLLADASLLPAPESDRLHALLWRIVEASLAAPDPPGTWCLAHSRHRAPTADAPMLTRLLQLFEDLNAFRDDAHMAAWRPLGLAGYVWEAFALLVAGSAASADALFQQLAYRGHSRSAYATALADLEARGWAQADGAGGYRVTEAGLAAHAQAEQATDAAFYAPWGTLSGAEQRELRQILLRMKGSAVSFT